MLSSTTILFIAILGTFLIVGLLLTLFLKKPERSAMWTGIGTMFTFFVGLYFTLLIPSFNNNWSSNTSEDQQHYHLPYTPQQLLGRRIYQREGCMYCHTQQIRPLINEMKRYSIGTSEAIPAAEREYVYDQPHFLGTRRIGPDLSRVGGKYSDDWHYSHFYYPRQMVPESVMPAFTWLFTKDPDGNPVPNAECRALVAYVQTLGYERQVYDPSLNGGKGGWRSWLKPQDQQTNQAIGENAIQHIQENQPYHSIVRGGGQKTPQNLIPAKPAQPAGNP